MRQLIELLINAAQKWQASPRGSSRGISDNEFDAWVEKLERCATDERSSSSERRFEVFEKEASRRLPTAAKDALGSHYVAILLMRSRRLSWNGGRTVLVDAPRPHEAVRKLADVVGSILDRSVQMKVATLQPELKEKHMQRPSAPSRAVSASASANPSAYPSSTAGGSSSSVGGRSASVARGAAPAPFRPSSVVTKDPAARLVSPSAPLANAARPPPGGLIVKGGKDEGIAETIAGTYVPSSTNHGRGVYRRTLPKSEGTSKVLMYYWDNRDGEENSGWWFGPEVGGEEVWAHHPGNSDSKLPPTSGWTALHSGEVDPDLTVLRADAPRPPGTAPSSAVPSAAAVGRLTTAAPASAPVWSNAPNRYGQATNAAGLRPTPPRVPPARFCRFGSWSWNA